MNPGPPSHLIARLTDAADEELAYELALRPGLNRAQVRAPADRSEAAAVQLAYGGRLDALGVDQVARPVTKEGCDSFRSRYGPAMSRSADTDLSLSPVTADDLDHAVQLAVTALREAPPAAWDGKAGSLEWDCWETVEHLSDDLFAYAAQLGPKAPPLDREVPFAWESRRPGGPANAIHANREAGPAGLLQVLEASGALLVAMVRTRPPQTRAHHVFGISDPEGFAAMGIVETLVHTHDLAQGLGLAWNPPAHLCARVLARLFPDAPESTDPWPTLLWATGRAALPGRPRLNTWRWDGTPRA